MSKISGNGVKTFFASSFETCCKLDAFHPFNLQYAAKMIIESRSTTKKCKLNYHKKQNDAVLQEMQNSVCFPCWNPRTGEQDCLESRHQNQTYSYITKNRLSPHQLKPRLEGVFAEYAQWTIAITSHIALASYLFDVAKATYRSKHTRLLYV